MQSCPIFRKITDFHFCKAFLTPKKMLFCKTLLDAPINFVSISSQILQQPEMQKLHSLSFSATGTFSSKHMFQ